MNYSKPIGKTQVGGSQILRDFKESTEAFSKPNRHSKNTGLQKLHFLKQAKPIQKGLESIATAAFFSSRRHQEWNPFTQRVLIHRFDQRAINELDEFERLNACSIGLIESVHELFHILCLEPLFRGQESIQNLADFTHISLTIEALCFWIGDIVLTKKIDFLYPDQQPIFYKRRSASSEYFHPYKAFSCEGYKDEKDILEMVLECFLGYKTPLSQFKTPAGRQVGLTLYGFHMDHHRPLAQLFDGLTASQMWGEYFSRFCEPLKECTLLGEWPLGFDEMLKDPHQLVRKVPKIYSYLQDLNSAQLRWWRLRRKIQTRAYFSYAAMAALEFCDVVHLRGENVKSLSSLERAHLSEALKTHLIDLEKNLQLLISAPIARAESRLRSTDLQYQKKMRRFSQIHIARRPRIYPLPNNELPFGLLDTNIKLTRELAFEIGRRIEEDYSTLSGNEQIKNAAWRIRFLSAQNNFYSKNTSASVKNFLTIANEWIANRPIEHGLASLVQNPCDEEFHEVLFLYS